MAASASCHVFLLDVRPSSRDQPMGTYERPINLYIPWNPGTLEQRQSFGRPTVTIRHQYFKLIHILAPFYHLIHTR